MRLWPLQDLEDRGDDGGRVNVGTLFEHASNFVDSYSRAPNAGLATPDLRIFDDHLAGRGESLPTAAGARIVEVLSLALGLGNAESERAQSVAAPDPRKLSASQQYSNLSPFSLLHCVGLLRRDPRAILPITQGRDAGPAAHRPKSVAMR